MREMIEKGYAKAQAERDRERQVRGKARMLSGDGRMGFGIDDQVLVDAEADGLTPAETGEAVGMSFAMVSVRLRRAKARGMRPRREGGE